MKLYSQFLFLCVLFFLCVLCEKKGKEPSGEN